MLVAAMAVIDVSMPSVGSAATTLPSGFTEQIVFSGLNRPTNIEFAPDGRIFVAEQRGIIKVFDDLADTAPTVFADLRTQVMSQYDRGLLGLALAPTFPTDPSVYVLYTYDAPLGQTAPVWNDACPDVSNGQCVVSARLSRLTAAGNVMSGTERVLVSDWCQQYSSHSIGDLKFGADGALYVSAGDGANFNTTDYGHLASSANPCADPPGGAMAPPSAEGGALRSQDVRTTADATGLDGTILRLDPATGLAMAGNPMIGSADLNSRRIVAYGLRNPTRFTIRPGTNEIWAGDVGWSTWEEINRVPDPIEAVTNFGWPCYEGATAQGAYDAANLSLCESLYSGGGAIHPYLAYKHSDKVVAGETCPTGSSSPTGVAFYPGSGGSYPSRFAGALFFADYSRKCIWAMKSATPGDLPSPTAIETFAADAATPVDLAVGPGGELYYVDIVGGTVRRIRYHGANTPPTAVISAAPTGGAVPLTVAFDGTGSTDSDVADQGRLSFSWNFGDGSPVVTTATAAHTYATAGTFDATLTVTDTLGAIGTTTVRITPGNNSPTATIDTPAAGATWRVGQSITFSGHATDIQDGALPAAALSWHLQIQHCSSATNCHTHFLQDWDGVASGSFVAPDHEYPSYLELELVATDSTGLTHSTVRRLDPLTAEVTFASSPPGLDLTVGAFTGVAPFTRTLIQGATETISAPNQTSGPMEYAFSSWSDGGANVHVVTVPTVATTYTATFTGTPSGANLALNAPSSSDSSCSAAEGADKAVNGSWTGGLYDKWCSKSATRWMRVDLGSLASISQFVVRHAGAGGETTLWNTRAFTIQVSADGVSWSTPVTVSANTASVSSHPVAVSGRYVRLNVTTPTQNTNTAARIYEFEVWGSKT